MVEAEESLTRCMIQLHAWMTADEMTKLTAKALARAQAAVMKMRRGLN